MKVLCFGSLNLDKVYAVPHFLRPGETASADDMREYCGGKGLNQSVALARAGARVSHAGCVGADGGALVKLLADNGVDTTLIRRCDGPSGHAVIQVAPSGQNCILLFGGANQKVTPAFAEEVLAHFDAGDYLVLQNEISGLEFIMRAAAQRGMKIVLNPSPVTSALKQLPIEEVDCLILNEGEARDLCGEAVPDAQLPERLHAQYPKTRIVLTLGEKGSVYFDGSQRVEQAAYRVKAVDTTAAGDTFTGFFVAEMAAGAPIAQAMETAAKASAIAVCRKGAAPSIPMMGEVQNFLVQQGKK